MLSYFKTGISLIVIGLLTIVTAYPVTAGSAFFFTIFISMVLILIGLLQIWLDRDDYVESENR